MSSPSERRLSYSHLKTTSDKIRWLAAQGIARADIARELGVRYQHVRNVLEHDKAKGPTGQGRQARPKDDMQPLRPTKVRLGPDGRVVVPAAIRDALGLKEGDALVASLEAGEIHLLTMRAAAKRAQAIVRQFVPEGISLVDELLEDRRREVEREERGD